jgi:hypothetical protein
VGNQIRYLRLRLAPPERGVNAGKKVFVQKQGEIQDFLMKMRSEQILEMLSGSFSLRRRFFPGMPDGT